MNVKKFSLEDAVEYVLGTLDPKKRQLFEIELKHNEELQEILKLIEVNKEFYEEIEQHQYSENYLNKLYHKAKNILSETPDYSIGSVFKIETSDLPIKYRKFLDDLFFVIINKSTFLNSREDFRVVPLSRLTNFVQNYDIVFSDNLISNKELNVVAHIHLVTNVIKQRLKYYLGKLKVENYEAIAHADLKDYSLADNKSILKGSEYRKRFPVDEYFDEEFEIWNSTIQGALHLLRSEVFEKIEQENIIYEEETTKLPLDADVLASTDDRWGEIEQRMGRMARFNFQYSIKKTPTKYYEMDDEGFLIVRFESGQFRNKYPNLKIKKFSKQIIKIDYERLSKMIYYKVDQFINVKSIKESIENYSIKKFDYGDIVNIGEELRFAARHHTPTKLPDIDILLFEDDKISILFSFYADKLMLEINFLKKEKVHFIENFYFVILANSSGFMVPQIPVNNNQAQIPMGLEVEDINNLQDGYIIGFIYNGKSVKLYLRLVLH